MTAGLAELRFAGVTHMSIAHRGRTATRNAFSAEEARRVGEQIGIDWTCSPFDVEQFRVGMEVELEHGRRDLATNVTDDEPVITGKIALAHLNEFPDYYWRLRQMETQAEVEAGIRRAFAYEDRQRSAALTDRDDGAASGAARRGAQTRGGEL